MQQSKFLSFNTLRQFIVFAGSGAIATAIQYTLLILIVELFGSNPVLATGISFAIAAVVNYMLSYKLVFKSKKNHYEAFIKYMVVASVGLLLNITIMHIGTTIFYWHYFLSQLLATAIVLLFNFFLNKIWTFSHNPT